MKDRKITGLGEELRSRRLAAHLSQGDLEDRSGVPKARISRYENQHITPDLATLIDLGEGLNTAPSTILKTVGL